MSATTGISPINQYRLIGKNEETQARNFAKYDTRTKSDIDYLKKQASKLTSASALLKDYRSLSIVLNAFGMSDEIQQTALLRQLMTQDPTSKTSTASKLASPLYTRFAKAMGQFNPPPFSQASNVAAITAAVTTNNFETQQDATSPGIGNALYFKRTIGSITSLAQLMSDPKLLKVATTATNMPDQFGTMDYTAQVKLLSNKLDIKNFQSSNYVDKFVTKYLAINMSNNSQAEDKTGALAILTGSGTANDIVSTLYPRIADASTSSSLLTLFA